jgi:predicted nuclease of predicted toxin-antitoxin system
MRFVIDQQLPPALAMWLVDRGHDAEHVYWIGLDQVDDPVIWDYALDQSAIVVTKDVDFAERRMRLSAGPQIVWLRIGNTTKDELFRVLDGVWPTVEVALATEAIVEVR